MTDIPRVLFICTHDAGRSQVAAALLDHEAYGRVQVTSAGCQPASELNPAVVQAITGLDISREFPKALTGDKVPSRRHRDHHGLRRCLPRLPRQASSGLGPTYPTPQASTWRQSAPSAMTSAAASANCSPAWP